MPDEYTIAGADGRLVAAAVHAGHEVRREVADLLALDEATRLREEDPATDQVDGGAPLRIVAHRSRFEVDLNRPRSKAVYQRPEDAWGLSIWREPLSEELVAGSLDIYDRFYASVASTFDALAAGGRFLVLDVHSYNHRRDPDREPAPVEDNPEVNVGTGTLDRARWAPVVDRFIDELGRQEVRGHRLDVRENVRFRGGHFSAWTHDRYPDTAVVLALELKKVFMDEWSGEIDVDHLDELQRAVSAAAPAAVDALQTCP